VSSEGLSFAFINGLPKQYWNSDDEARLDADGSMTIHVWSKCEISSRTNAYDLVIG